MRLLAGKKPSKIPEMNHLRCYFPYKVTRSSRILMFFLTGNFRKLLRMSPLPQAKCGTQEEGIFLTKMQKKKTPRLAFWMHWKQMLAGAEGTSVCWDVFTSLWFGWQERSVTIAEVGLRELLACRSCQRSCNYSASCKLLLCNRARTSELLRGSGSQPFHQLSEFTW